MGMGRLSDLDWFAWEGLGRIELVEWLGLAWIVDFLYGLGDGVEIGRRIGVRWVGF
jgi:hypothetical protein